MGQSAVWPRLREGGLPVTRRRVPRPASAALRRALEGAAPKTPLAAVQAAWAESVGERVAAAAEPVSERAGTVTVSCRDPVWAQELEMMQEQLLDRLRERLGERAPRTLRFRVEDRPT
jgi:predicted nucleic acid-binding Zn ribbon protein